MRFSYNTNRGTAPTIDRNVRTPTGWLLFPPSVTTGQYLWMTIAVINPNDTLYQAWSQPVCISGPQGATGGDGPVGATGATGIPGSSIIALYSAGSDSTPINRNPSGTQYNGWEEDINDVEIGSSSSDAYLWCIQGTKVYSSNDSKDYTISWGQPFRLTGEPGSDGSGYSCYVTPPVQNVTPNSSIEQTVEFHVVVTRNGKLIPYTGIESNPDYYFGINATADTHPEYFTIGGKGVNISKEHYSFRYVVKVKPNSGITNHKITANVALWGKSGQVGTLQVQFVISATPIGKKDRSYIQLEYIILIQYILQIMIKLLMYQIQKTIITMYLML